MASHGILFGFWFTHKIINDKTLNMTKSSFRWLFILLPLFSGLTSCEVIGGIFKAGVWSGVLIVVLIIALIIFVIAKMGKKS